MHPKTQQTCLGIPRFNDVLVKTVLGSEVRAEVLNPVIVLCGFRAK
jgi:hypothetical protein